MKEKNNILRIFEDSEDCIKKEKYSELASLSNQTINTASLTQDPDNIAVAVIIYSLNKIFSKTEEDQKIKKKVLEDISKIIKSMKKNNQKEIRKSLEKMREDIEKMSDSIKTNVKEVLRKAKINKGSRIFEHGVSTEVVAEILGLTQYELYSYVGQKDYEYSEGETMNVKKRIKLTERFFE